MAVNKSVAIGVGVPVAVFAVILAAKWSGTATFAKAAAEGNFERAERSAGILRLNERLPAVLILVAVLGPMLVGARLADLGE